VALVGRGSRRIKDSFGAIGMYYLTALLGLRTRRAVTDREPRLGTSLGLATFLAWTWRLPF
jgi:hypothetical protein